MDELLFQIGIVFITASIVGVIFYRLNQQLIIAYIFAGILLGGMGLGIIPYSENINDLASFGIIFLLYLVGLDLNIKQFKQIGLSALFIGFSEIFILGSITFGLFKALHYGSLESMYISLITVFSSTIVAIKILSDKKDLNTLYGQICIGILILQDIVAILALLFFEALKSGQDLLLAIPLTLAEGIIFCLISIYIAKYIVIKLFKYISHSQELLFLSGIAWCFILAMTAEYLGFSKEIGAFIAGFSLASSPYAISIIGKTKNLRNFFITIFFVLLGSQLTLYFDYQIVISFILLSGIVLIVKPILFSFLTIITGFQQRTGFLVGVSLSQISEFSLIIAALGLSYGHIDDKLFSLVTMLGISTITVSSFLHQNAESLYRKLLPALNLLNNPSLIKNIHEENSSIEQKNHIVLIGCDHFGQDVLEKLIELNDNYIVIDENPDIINHLKKHNINCIYGDMLNDYVIEKANLMTSQIIISTVSHFKDNYNLVTMLKSKREKPVIFVVARTPREGVDLKEAGADYIIIPHKMSGNTIGDIIQAIYSVKPINKNIQRPSYGRHSNDKWDYEKYLIKDILRANEEKISDIRDEISNKIK